MNIGLSRTGFLRSAAAAVALPSLSLRPIGASAADPTPFTVINTGANDSLALQQLIIDQKYFERFGLAVTTSNVSDGVKLLAGILNNPGAVAMLTGFGQIFPAIENGAGVKLIAGALQPPDVVIYSGNPAVKTLKDIEGKSVGTGAPGALIYQETVAMLKKAA